MEPLHFSSAVQIVELTLDHNNKIGHLNWVWIHFHENIHQGLNLLVLPALNHLIAFHVGHASSEAMKWTAIKAAANKKKASVEDYLKEIQENLKDRMSWPPEQQREVLRTVIEKVAKAVEEGGTSLHPIIISVYRSVLVQTYIAFESLAEELWEKALNFHPHDLSQVIFSERDKKGIMPEMRKRHVSRR